MSFSVLISVSIVLVMYASLFFFPLSDLSHHLLLFTFQTVNLLIQNYCSLQNPQSLSAPTESAWSAPWTEVFVGINGFGSQKNWPKFRHKMKTKLISFCEYERLIFPWVLWRCLIFCAKILTKRKSNFGKILMREFKYQHRIESRSHCKYCLVLFLCFIDGEFKWLIQSHIAHSF